MSTPMAVPVRRNSLHVVAMAPRTSSVEARSGERVFFVAFMSTVISIWWIEFCVGLLCYEEFKFLCTWLSFGCLKFCCEVFFFVLCGI